MISCVLWFWEQFDGDLRHALDSRMKSDKVHVCRELVLILAWFILAAHGLACDLCDYLCAWRPQRSRQRAVYLAIKGDDTDEALRLLADGVGSVMANVCQWSLLSPFSPKESRSCVRACARALSHDQLTRISPGLIRYDPDGDT